MPATTMVQIDLSLSAAVGATLAAAAHVQLRDEPRLVRNGYLAVTVAFTAFFVVPVVLLFLAGWPAWDTMYWFDRDDLPIFTSPLCALLVMASSATGFIAGHSLIRHGKEISAMLLPGLLVAPALAIIVIFHDRFLHVGTCESFAGGAPLNLFSSNLFFTLITAIPLFVGLPLAYLLWRWCQPALREFREQRRKSPIF